MNGTDFCDRFFKWSHRIIVKQKHITFLLKSTKKLWLGMSFLVAGVFAAVSRADSCRQWRGLRRSSSFLRSSLHSYPYALHSSPRSCNYHVSCCSANTKKIAASNYSLSCSVGGKNGRYYYCGTETEKRQKKTAEGINVNCWSSNLGISSSCENIFVPRYFNKDAEILEGKTPGLFWDFCQHTNSWK